jgi:2-keto-4-pentenoate hydratase/2-oxohepta-3-ene-1,7-dioic acid hydratase in catechol pathway
MRLVTWVDTGTERLGLERNGRVAPAADLVTGGPRTMRELFEGGSGIMARLGLAAEMAARSPGEALDSLELLAPVPRPGKVVAVGINYRDHASEGGREPPDHPVLFAKFPSSVVGHRAAIRWDPTLTDAVDYEAELAVVIGRTCRRVEPADALDHVLGYTCLNDVSARDLQHADRQFVRAKSLDSFCPMGPILVTTDDLPDPQALTIRATVNGEVRQEASTADMIFSVAELVSFCSQAFTLEPGDVIATGTPSGVGWYREPRTMLADGDEVVVEIEGIGRLVNVCAVERD